MLSGAGCRVLVVTTPLALKTLIALRVTGDHAPVLALTNFNFNLVGTDSNSFSSSGGEVPKQMLSNSEFSKLFYK